MAKYDPESTASNAALARPSISTHAPQLSLGLVPPPIIASPYSNNDIPIPTIQHPQPTSAAMPINSPLSPTHIPPRRLSVTPVRRPSAGIEHASASPTPPSYADSVMEPDGSTWSSAVGRAGLGKSGRVIEDIQNSRDRLMRDLNVERKLREEAERRENLSGSTIEALRTENENLRQAKDTDAGIIRRRDRMIEDLRQKLESEKAARVRSDEAAGMAIYERDEAVSKATREVNEAREKETHSDASAQTAHDSLRRQRERNDMLEKRLTRQAEVQAEKTKARDVVQEQLQHHLSQQEKTVRDLRAKTEHFTRSVEAYLIAQAEAARERFRKEGRVTQAMEHVVGEASQYIRLAALQLQRDASEGISPESPISPTTPSESGSLPDGAEPEKQHVTDDGTQSREEDRHDLG